MNKAKDSIFIVIPAYNEEANIEKCINDWYPIVESYNGEGLSRLVVINDGSNDSTYEKLQELTATRPLLIPLTKTNGGHGSAVLYGYRYAIEQGADWIFQTDSDGQTNPVEFEKFWKHRTEYDAVIGVRNERGDGKRRKFIEDIVCLILRLMFGVKVTDANAPFRLMKTCLVQKYIDKLPFDFNIPNIMFTTYFVYHNDRVVFLPITFQPRKRGENTINLKKILRIGWQAVRDFRKLRREIDD